MTKPIERSERFARALCVTAAALIAFSMVTMLISIVSSASYAVRSAGTPAIVAIASGVSNPRLLVWSLLALALVAYAKSVAGTDFRVARPVAVGAIALAAIAIAAAAATLGWVAGVPPGRADDVAGLAPAIFLLYCVSTLVLGVATIVLARTLAGGDHPGEVASQ